MKATVLYYSHKGKTAGYAREIAMFLWSQGVSVSLCAITEFDSSRLAGSDLLITGCWTCGWFVVGQHPHERWVEASRRLAGILPAERTLLFTTYRIRTGCLFSRMKKVLGINSSSPVHCLKSKTGRLTDADKLQLQLFVGMQKKKL